MTKKEVQEYLSSYKDDDELFVIWWDKEFIDYISGYPITNKEWKIIVDRLDDYGFDNINEVMYGMMQEELSIIRKK